MQRLSIAISVLLGGLLLGLGVLVLAFFFPDRFDLSPWEPTAPAMYDFRAEASLSGKISLDGDPLAATRVDLVGHDQRIYQTRTDKHGRYSFQAIPAGPYLLLVDHPCQTRVVADPVVALTPRGKLIPQAVPVPVEQVSLPHVKHDDPGGPARAFLQRGDQTLDLNLRS